MSSPVALICSVTLEAEPLLGRISSVVSSVTGGRATYDGLLGTTPVVLVVGGMGKTNAAQALTALLERRRIRAVVGFGVAGAYPGRGLEICGVALARAEIYADEGVQTPHGWFSTREIGIPLAASPSGDLFNDFPADGEMLRAAAGALSAAGMSFSTGPIATVSCCSGTTVQGEAIAERFGAICETMEGAAYAHVATLYGVPYLGVRGVSNLVEDRDLSAWRLSAAADAAAEAVARIATAV